MREDQIRDFLNTVSIPGIKESLLHYSLPPVIQATQVHVIFEVPPPLLESVHSLVPFVKEWLKKTFPKHEIICGVTSVKKASLKPKLTFERIKHIVCVASGKGGVGKSTTALGVAIALQQVGKRVGLLDGDIHGPSLPKMLNLQEKPSLTADKKIIPLSKHGLQILSIGLMVSKEDALIWRGPMVQGAFLQLLKEADWDVDILIIDMPPGTGDVHLTAIQTLPLSGVIIVSTPQDMALIDARRAIALFHKADVAILGIIENMSVFECPHCHHQTPIFDCNGARHMSEELDIPFMGEIPFHMDMRLGADQGNPPTLDPAHPLSPLYQKMAIHILASI